MCGSSCTLITAAILAGLGAICCGYAAVKPAYTLTNVMIPDVSVNIDLWSGDVTCKSSDSPDNLAALAADLTTKAACDYLKSTGLSLTDNALTEGCGYSGGFWWMKVAVVIGIISAFIGGILAFIGGGCATSTSPGVPGCGVLFMGLGFVALCIGSYNAFNVMGLTCHGVSLNNLVSILPGFILMPHALIAIGGAAFWFMIGGCIYLCGATQFNSQRTQQNLNGGAMMVAVQQPMLVQQPGGQMMMVQQPAQIQQQVVMVPGQQQVVMQQPGQVMMAPGQQEQQPAAPACFPAPQPQQQDQLYGSPTAYPEQQPAAYAPPTQEHPQEQA